MTSGASCCSISAAELAPSPWSCLVQARLMPRLLIKGAAYLAAAREESTRRQVGQRITLIHGNFTTLERNADAPRRCHARQVICCYPDLESLLTASTARTRRLYGIIHPRDNRWVRLAVAVENAVSRRRRRSFRVFVFSNTVIGQTIQRARLSLVKSERDLSWVIALYERRNQR